MRINSFERYNYKKFTDPYRFYALDTGFIATAAAVVVIVAVFIFPHARPLPRATHNNVPTSKNLDMR